MSTPAAGYQYSVVAQANGRSSLRAWGGATVPTVPAAQPPSAISRSKAGYEKGRS